MVYLYDACDQISDFCHQQLLRKMWRKISWTDGRTDGRKDRGKTVYPPPPSGSGGIKKRSTCLSVARNFQRQLKKNCDVTWSFSLGQNTDLHGCSSTEILILIVIIPPIFQPKLVKIQLKSSFKLFLLVFKDLHPSINGCESI